MIPFVLPNVFSIAKLCNQAEFEKHIFVHLKSIMSLQEPVQILLIFMQNMELMLKLTSPNDVKMYVLPMMYKALESNSSQIQELCLEIIPSFAYLVDFQSMKNSLLPRIKHICNSNGSTSMRVNCLLCIGKLLPHLDKWVCLDEILLFLPTVSSREPAVIMALIGIFKVAANHELLGIPKEFCVRKVLPFLWPLSIENGLTLQQYNTIMAFIKDLEKRIETEHKATLQQLDTEDTSALPVAFDQRQVDVVPTNLTINNRDSKRFGRSSLKSVMKFVASVRPQTSLTSTTTTQPLGYPSLHPTPKQTSPPIMDMFGSWSMNDTSNQAQQRPLLVSANNNFPGSLSANYLNNNGFGSSSMPLAIENASNKFQRPLLANLTNPDKLNTNYKPNNGNGSSNSILTKEDILEFLK
ncbi:conserved hypothetical protein [Culex quinquefasciatus]|uniref:SCY1-like protein 2 n=1 Tax=Culex quinquefasciatus TaxID=7176 RepID=B0XH97_CULQU|nr:conserved hypothetical protein [Culex quinquefasciatus]|eukprot:XP_001869019.1 conserved hypothetical protein [Culex quinquefasciatus]